MDKILIPISYHPVSEKIVKEGCALAKKLNAKVCLLHVTVEPNFYSVNYPAFAGYAGFGGHVVLENEEETRKVAEEFLEEAARNTDLEVEKHVEYGNTAECILEYAEKWGADMIVLGTHSRGILKKVFIGSKAAEVLDKTKIPVYMVPVKK